MREDLAPIVPIAPFEKPATAFDPDREVMGRIRSVNRGTGAALNLLCLPYAGGSARIFRGWERALRNVCGLMVAELAGRDSLADRLPARHLEQYVQALTTALLVGGERDLVLFGHSMGALLAFEIARLLRRQARQPRAIFVSGHRAPQVPDPRQPIHKLSDADFLAEVQLLKGVPEPVLNNRHLLEYCLTLLRADFSCCETYRYSSELPLDCPIVAFGAAADPEVDIDALAAWHLQTTAEFKLKIFQGGHFFIHESQAELLKTLHTELTQL